MVLRLIGIKNYTGVGIHYTNFCAMLSQYHSLGITIEEVDGADQQALANACTTSQDRDINICWLGMNLKGHMRGTNIQWIVFESTQIPVQIRSALDTADWIWVPSTWGKQVLINNGYESGQINIVPEGVDPQQFHPYNRASTSATLRFLSVGKFEQRKSFVELLTAWKTAFGGCTDVSLLIKSHAFSNNDLVFAEFNQLLHNLDLKNVVIHWGGVEDITDYYRQSHVFVLASKGEGWGLPLIEAAAQGLPIITTNYSAHSDYLKFADSSCIFVDYKLGAIECNLYKECFPGNADLGQWAMPSVDSIARALVNMKENFDLYSQNALVNAQTIRTKYSWAQCVDTALQTLTRQNLL